MKVSRLVNISSKIKMKNIIASTLLILIIFSCTIPYQKLHWNYSISKRSCLSGDSGYLAGTIKGVFVEYSNNFPDTKTKVLYNAKISILNTQYNTSTNSSGEYIIKNIKPGKYSVKIEYNHPDICSSKFEDIRIEIGYTTVLNVTLLNH